MNTKEAIEHIKHKYVAYDDEYCAGTEECEKLYKQQDEVIETLKRGEKYEKMWEELKNNFPYLRGELEVKEFIEEFEKKYL